MSFRKTFAVPALSAALLLAVPAVAQQPELRAGAAVTDPQGDEVGTIVEIDGDHVLLRTDRHQVRLPRASFAATAEGAIFSVTREQLNADLDRMMAQANEAIAPGATVRDPNGVVAGTVDSADAEFVTLRVGEGLVRLPRRSVSPAQDGLMVSLTAAELAAQAAPAPASEGAAD